MKNFTHSADRQLTAAAPTRRTNTATLSQRLLAPVFGAALLSGLSLPALADAIGVRAGAYAWNPDISGTVRAGGQDVDLHDDLGFSDENANVFFVSIEHPLPLLPNILVQHTKLDASATNTLTRTITFDDTTYIASDRVKTTLDLSHTDATLYYELLDNWVELDLGLTVRVFENGVKIKSVNTGQDAKLDFNSVIPMVYAAARFNLPLSGLYVAVDGNGIGYSGNTLFDYRAMVGYESPIGLGAQVGIRNFDLNYEDGDDEGDVKIDGAFAEIFYHF